MTVTRVPHAMNHPYAHMAILPVCIVGCRIGNLKHMSGPNEPPCESSILIDGNSAKAGVQLISNYPFRGGSALIDGSLARAGFQLNSDQPFRQSFYPATRSSRTTSCNESSILIPWATLDIVEPGAGFPRQRFVPARMCFDKASRDVGAVR